MFEFVVRSGRGSGRMMKKACCVYCLEIVSNE